MGTHLILNGQMQWTLQQMLEYYQHHSFCVVHVLPFLNKTRFRMEYLHDLERLLMGGRLAMPVTSCQIQDLILAHSIYSKLTVCMEVDLSDRRRDHTLAGPLWEGYHESKRCSRDTYPESYITKYTSIRRKHHPANSAVHTRLTSAFSEMLVLRSHPGFERCERSTQYPKSA